MAEEDNLYSIFKNIASDDLNSIVSNIPTPRVLTFLKKTYQFIMRALPQKTLQSLNTMFEKIIFLEDFKPLESSGIVCCFCLDDPEEAKYVCEKFQTIPNYNKFLIMIPRISTLCQEIVERSGIKLQLLEYHLEIIPLDSFNFIVPSPKCFSHCFVEDDISDVYTIARSLLKLELINGVPSRVFTAGDISSRVYTLVEEFKSQVGPAFLQSDPQIHEMFIVDRTVDLLTPLLTQFYYGGFLDDKYEINFGFMNLPDGVVLKRGGKTVKETLLADAEDEVFAEIRSMSCTDAGNRLRDLMNEMQTIKEKMTNTTGTSQWTVHAKRAKKLNELAPFVDMHFDILEKLLQMHRYMKPMMNYEYALMLREDPDTTLLKRLINSNDESDALRLLCLTSVISRGVPSSVLSDTQNRLISKYGTAIVKDLINLGNAGLLVNEQSLFEKSKYPKFQTLDETLKLVFQEPQIIKDENGTIEHTDVESGYDTYVPILLRLVQAGISGKWEKGTPVEKLMCQMGVDHQIHGQEWVRKVTAEGLAPKRILVFVIGGVTATEVMLLHQMGKIIFKGEVDIHVGSTNITTGKKLINQVCPTIAKGAPK
ncbi:Sec1 family protein [Histomonas meleagridis]|uniref:Sec1 family protein n=1 Tax=Histomonas meleagridis TaxID=135588 RepID=UPI00355A986C|nr:Sec1 family protein [Histomonas meleagridis]KAH0796780.1 Sec1 family protein [Histomonas meleagridis]